MRNPDLDLEPTFLKTCMFKKKRHVTCAKPHDENLHIIIPHVDEVHGLKTGIFHIADKNINLVQPFRKTIWE